jgi:indoleamine 2,3-dioxygenase
MVCYCINGEPFFSYFVCLTKVAHSGKLISAAEDCITAAMNKQRDAFNDALGQLYNAYQAINQSMDTMWGRSKPADYVKFRYVFF